MEFHQKIYFGYIKDRELLPQIFHPIKKLPQIWIKKNHHFFKVPLSQKYKYRKRKIKIFTGITI